MSQPYPPKHDPNKKPDPSPTKGSSFAPNTNDERTMAMLAHLLGVLMGFVGPLIIWLIKKDESSSVDDQGKEALNFHITLLIAYVVVIALTFVTCGVGAILFPVLAVLQIVFGVIGAVEANKGVAYRYPMIARMIQ